MSTRDDILAAALACFIERGVSQTTIGDIRQRSGASTGSIYHHFSSKERLAGLLYLDALDDYHRGALARIAPESPVEVGIGALIEHHLSWCEHNEDLARYMLLTGQAEATGAVSSEVSQSNATFLAAIHQWLRPFVASGEVVRVPIDLYLSLILGPSHELVRHWLAGRITTPLLAATDVMASAAWASISNQRNKT